MQYNHKEQKIKQIIRKAVAYMTFKVIVTYKVHDGSVMTKELTGVEKVEKTWEKIGGDNVEIVKVYENSWQWYTWAAAGILNINMIAEQ
jgi:hypothetical protein|nr:MAG TPA: hypothetical protein [Caudoviricetes sp.]